MLEIINKVITKEEVQHILDKVFVCIDNGNFIISQGHNRL